MKTGSDYLFLFLNQKNQYLISDFVCIIIIIIIIITINFYLVWIPCIVFQQTTIKKK